MDVLERAQTTFSERPIAAAVTKSLTALEVRRSLGKAARAARPRQAPASLYDPLHAPALVVLKAEDLVSILEANGRSGT